MRFVIYAILFASLSACGSDIRDGKIGDVNDPAKSAALEKGLSPKELNYLRAYYGLHARQGTLNPNLKIKEVLAEIEQRR